MTHDRPRKSSGTLSPSLRALQIYAFDPSFELDLATARVNRATISVVWEALRPGPVGDYLEVIDVDPASDCVYAPVDLDDPHLLAQDGLAPSEGDPRFHQQMVYAVAMRTIASFERALGRSVHWSPRLRDDSGAYIRSDEVAFVRRLRIYPHALREANAYYSPDKKALLFGYFNANNDDARQGLPGGMIFTCLSHDVIAHETTHAILDGIHRRMLEPSNPDVLAFHEAFADLVAIFQHFSLPGVLLSQIVASRGNLAVETVLAKLAVQFGRGTGYGDSLRDALGETDPATGIWRRAQPDPNRLARETEPHKRGAILVAAIFDAFVAIYESHIADLQRIATGGTGRLPEGDIHPDLAKRMAQEAEKVAGRVLTMCLRAIDYLPPVDVTFGDYVRSLITADVDYMPEDSKHYRVALIAALRNRGIYPRDVRTLSVESLCWQRFGELFGDDEEDLIRTLLPPVGMLRLMAYANNYTPIDFATARCQEDLEVMTRSLADAYRRIGPRDVVSVTGGRNTVEADLRFDEFRRQRQFGTYLHQYLRVRAHDVPVNRRDCVIRMLGVDPFDERRRFEVHAVRPTNCAGTDGRTKTKLLILLTQRRDVSLDFTDSDEEERDADGLSYRFRGGTTLLIDPDAGEVVYSITKPISSVHRQQRQEAFLRDCLGSEGIAARARYSVRAGGEDKVPQEPFRLLHGSSDRIDR